MPLNMTGLTESAATLVLLECKHPYLSISKWLIRKGRISLSIFRISHVYLMLEIIRDTLKNTDQVSDQVTDQVDTPVQRLLSVLGNETLPATEIMKRLGLSHRPTFRKNYLDPALEAEKLNSPDLSRAHPIPYGFIFSERRMYNIGWRKYEDIRNRWLRTSGKDRLQGI